MFIRGGIRSVRHFPCTFPHRMALAKCPCKSRLHRLAQNGCCGRSVRHFPCKFPQNGCCEMSMCISTAPVRTKRGRRPGRTAFSLKFLHKMALRLRRRARNMAAAGVFGVFPVNFHTKWLLRNVHVRVGCASSHKTRHLIQKSCQETSYRELVQRSVQLTEIFPTELL